VIHLKRTDTLDNFESDKKECLKILSNLQKKIEELEFKNPNKFRLRCFLKFLQIMENKEFNKLQ